jgi:hypothetical protein
MDTIVKNPLGLPDRALEDFAEAFRTNAYEIITLRPTAENTPESLIDSYHDPLTYGHMFSDPQAVFHFFSLRYRPSGYPPTVIPIGVFGESERRNIRFPLVLNGFWQAFVMSTSDTFSQLSQLAAHPGRDAYYARFSALKKSFIHNAFRYYHCTGPQGGAAMAFELRGAKSNTRSIAESLGFHRQEAHGMEIYNSVETEPQGWKYLKECTFRWSALLRDKKQGDYNQAYPLPKVQLFVRRLVSCEVPVNC